MTDRPIYGRWPSPSDARRSLALDAAMLGVSALPATTRARLLWHKWRAAAAIVRGRSYAIGISKRTFEVRSMSDLGTFQATIVDVYEELVVTGVLADARFVVDVGANIGQWTSAVKLFAPDVEVLSIEPDPDIFERLESNVGSLAGVTCRCLAAGASSEPATLYRHELSLMSTLHPGTAGYDETNTVAVSMDTLDHLVDRPIDLLKIDVEGAELDVLTGAAATLDTTRFLVVELSLGRAAVGSALETLDHVRRCAPTARIVMLGRPMGGSAVPDCQDALIELHPVT
ncbi:MAG: hypothetical protein NVSMB16_04450 [Acidimicrobiales bacterium]